MAIKYFLNSCRTIETQRRSRTTELACRKVIDRYCIVNNASSTIEENISRSRIFEPCLQQKGSLLAIFMTWRPNRGLVYGKGRRGIQYYPRYSSILFQNSFRFNILKSSYKCIPNISGEKTCGLLLQGWRWRLSNDGIQRLVYTAPKPRSSSSSSSPSPPWKLQISNTCFINTYSSTQVKYR